MEEDRPDIDYTEVFGNKYPEPTSTEKPIEIIGVGNRMGIKTGNGYTNEWGRNLDQEEVSMIKSNLQSPSIANPEYFGLQKPDEEEMQVFEEMQQYKDYVKKTYFKGVSDPMDVRGNSLLYGEQEARDMRNKMTNFMITGEREARNELREKKRQQAAEALEKKKMELKTASEAAKEELAQSLAKGDMTRIRDVMSLRSSGGAMTALEVFRRARELNPKFSTAEIERKIKLESDFTTGKDAQNIQSFGIFLEHAAAADAAVDAIKSKQARLVNKPLNYLKKNIMGDPDFQAFMTSLEPVRKEFEGFLLGGRALYADDRKQAEIILSDDSSPEQVKAALRQMGHTAKARFNEMNYRYKRTMGMDLQEPFSAEAIDAAKRIGVDLMGGKWRSDMQQAGGAKRTIKLRSGKIIEVED